MACFHARLSIMQTAAEHSHGFYFALPRLFRIARSLDRTRHADVDCTRSFCGRCLAAGERPALLPQGVTSPTYQRTSAAPKNIQTTAPKARYGPNGNLADQTRFPKIKV